ncbi:MFS general substrate transporter [Polychaeton citri CBS 116435]|uniref:MFS general substrate transporter n=1 Tax=Polychaeton citri CBS 116435 TaxID=1314669 RepID=A0A9P4UP38_9PEZI|nr:MFS general substrate transporter [Polychaeton citri CBS 116435]
MRKSLQWLMPYKTNDPNPASPSSASPPSTKPPVLLPLRSSRTFIIITVATAVFTDIFAYGIVVPVLPFALTSRAGVEPSEVQNWVSILLAIYGAALLVAAPFCGWAADRYSSRRVPLLAGLVALGGSTAMLCAGSSLGMLAAGRALQGVSAAVVWVVGLALLVDTVGPEEVGVAMGYVGLSMSLALLIAPLLGGIVFAKSGYYAVFSMAFGLIVLDVLLRFVMVEKKVAARFEVDGEGDDAVTTEQDVSVKPVAVESSGKQPRRRQPMQSKTQPADEGLSGDDALEMQPQHQIDDRQDQKQATASRPAEQAEGPSTEPNPTATNDKPRFFHNLPPIFALLGSRRLLAALVGCTMQATLLTSFDSLLPLFVKQTFKWDSIGAGLIFLPIVGTSFLSPFFGHLSDKYGPRWLATAGFLAGCPFLILLRLVDSDTLRQKVLLCALLALIGITLTLVLTPLMAEITYAVDAKARRRAVGYFGRNGAYAQAYSLFNMAWAAGSMAGPLLGGMVNSSEGWPTATLILGVVSAATAVPTVIWTGGSIFGEVGSRRWG